MYNEPNPELLSRLEQSRQDLTQENRSLAEMVQKLEQDIRDLQQKELEQASRVSAMAETVQETQRLNYDLEQKNQQQKQELEIMTNNVEEITNKLQLIHIDFSRLEFEYERSVNILQDKNETLRDMTKECNMLRNSLLSNEVEMIRATTRLERFGVKAEEYRNELQQAKEEIEKYRCKSETLTRRLTEAEICVEFYKTGYTELSEGRGREEDPEPGERYICL